MGNQIGSTTTTFEQVPYHCRDSNILSRQEAKSKLRKLTPGTEEYSKLESALHRTADIMEIILPNDSYRVNTYEDKALVGGFGSSEHVAIGEAIILQGLEKEDKLLVTKEKTPTPLMIKGVTPIFFEHIIALAGDFYGIYGKAISLPGGYDQEKTERFKQAFDTLAKADNNELRKILFAIKNECYEVKNSSLPHHCYSSQMMEKNKEIKKIKKDVDALLIDNSDHFFTHAWEAYRIGHAYAVSVAHQAGKQADKLKSFEQLKLAYALDAFAIHFLTDLFASGHIRNQRGQLETFLISQLRFSEEKAKALAGILTGAQHEKDGHEGLNVVNKKGEEWRAYGDGSFFGPKNEENKKRSIAAVQQSVDEIFAAYSNPDLEVKSVVDQLIPHVTPFNPPPLYSIEGSSLFLYDGIDKIEIKTQADYLIKGVQSQALKFLPEDYIVGFTTPFNIELPPLLTKVIIPHMERFTGSIWHLIGLATYHQVKKENRQLNQKIDEMADIVKATYDMTLKLQKQMEVVNTKLDQLLWNDSFKEVHASIGITLDITHEYQTYKGTLSDDQLKQGERKLWQAHLTMSRVFSQGKLTDGTGVMANYETMLKSNPEMNPTQNKIALTLWLRQMLDYQVQAFGLYATYRAMRSKDQYEEVQVKRTTDLYELEDSPITAVKSTDKIEGKAIEKTEGKPTEKKMKSYELLQIQIAQFETILLKQVDAHKNFIDEELIYLSQRYIQLQLEKSKAKNVAFKELKF